MEWRRPQNKSGAADVSVGGFQSYGQVSHLDEGQFLTTTVLAALLLAGACRRKAERVKLVGILKRLDFFSIYVSRGRFGS